ncbi:MAG TPA: DUF4019 domain-containing protein [Pyrinomonadaceae bacterium]
MPNLILFLSLLLSPSSSASSQNDRPIKITIPGAPWALTFRNKHLSVEDRQVKPDGRHGYFLLSDNQNKITISMYVEPADKCKSSKECRDMVWKAGNPTWENPQNVVMGEIGEVSFFEFLMPSFRGMPVQQQHLYAQFVVDQFWVDMHISKISYQPKDHKLFEEIIKSIRFQPKSADDSLDEDARKAADAWMVLWDGGDYDKSYEELAEEARTTYTRRQWYALWYGLRKPLGKVKARRLTRIENGLVQGAKAVMYETSFENDKQEVRETLGLRLEKDGTWRVFTYVSNIEPRR